MRRVGHDGDGTAAPTSGVHVPAFHTTNNNHPLIPTATPAAAAVPAYARAGNYDGPDSVIREWRTSFQTVISVCISLAHPPFGSLL